MKKIEVPLEVMENEVQTKGKILEGLESMTEEEALKALGMEQVPIYQGLEEMLRERSPLARKVIEFLMENYPEQIPILMATNQMEQLLDQRVEEAKAMFQRLHPMYQKSENVAGMETMQRLQTENQIAQIIWEQINQEILYRPLVFGIMSK